MQTGRANVSIIVPVYNTEQYLHACVQSLLHQSLRDIEIVLINDASTDASGGMCDSYQEQDARIRVIHNSKNIGEGASRNKGIEASTGEYLAFADSDDYVDTDFYEKLYRAARAADADIAKGGRIKTYPGGMLEKQEKMNVKIRRGLAAGVPLFALFNYEHTTAIFRAAAVAANQHIRYPDIKIGLDVVFLLKATFFMRNITMVDGTYYYYRQHAASVSSVKDRSYYEGILTCFEQCLDFLNACDLPKRDYDPAFRNIAGLVVTTCRGMQNNAQSSACREAYLKTFFAALARYAFLDIGTVEAMVSVLADRAAGAQAGPGSSVKRDLAFRMKRLAARFFKT